MNGSVEASKQFTVGDHIGWQQPSDNNTDVYGQWATSKRFHVGDSVSFEYRNDSVLLVDKWDYYHCNSNNPIYSFNDGNTVINLDRAGFFYFISGILDHCKNGERLMIQVMGLHQRPEPTPAVANPHEVGLAPGPHPSSGIVVTAATLASVFLALIVTVVALE
ncbi:integral membrane family protein [Hibiscus syriacus]|uniref:Integral membrane family protein n=2 Tax=Hibiscus syriacus TaxID=106335 RepID=A0A6A3A562_HIBSY|nr:integral membrane family protein [Hibiscus syriacus]